MTVVVVNYRTPEDVETLVRDLSRQEQVLLDCVCVDITGDVDGLRCARILDGSSCSWSLVRSANVGYGSANNAALRVARESRGARWAIVCNPDIEIPDPLAVRELLHALLEAHETGAWLAGPRVSTPDGRLQNPYLTSDLSSRAIRVNKAKYLWPLVSHVFGGLQLVWHATRSLTSPVLRTSVADVCDHTYAQRVFAVHGSFLMMDLELMSQGGVFPPFDERIFMYGEEIALARRVLLAGGAEVYVPSVEVIHKEDGSNRSAPPTRTLLRTLRQYRRSRKLIMRDYYRTTRA